MENEPQADAAVIIEPAFGGQVRLDADDYVVGGPELTGEIAASSASIDLNKKLRVYRRNQVKEYIVWQTKKEQIDWFHLRAGKYRKLKPDANGILKSRVFPGLWLGVEAALGFDMARVLEVLHRGLASPEHAEFVYKLAQRKV